MKTPRRLVVMILIYVALDLCLPAMPGAFVFDPDDSVESTHGSRDGSDAVFAHMLAPVLPLLTTALICAVVPCALGRSRRRRWSPRRTPAAPPTRTEPASLSEDSH